MERYLIVNADDFGLSRGVNRGIIQAHRHGIVTSASLMVRWGAAGEAANYARENPALGLGLHVDLGEWRFQEGQWVRVYEVVRLEDASAVAREVSDQVDAFRRLTGRDPTHLDSHQHVHQDAARLPQFQELSRRLGVPLRGHCSVVYCGAFYGQTDDGAALWENITPDALISVLKGLPSGYTELGCHPGYGDDLDTMYCRQRTREVETLCDSRVRAAVAAEGIRLCTFAGLLAA